MFNLIFPQIIRQKSSVHPRNSERRKNDELFANFQKRFTLWRRNCARWRGNSILTNSISVAIFWSFSRIWLLLVAICFQIFLLVPWLVWLLFWQLLKNLQKIGLGLFVLWCIQFCLLKELWCIYFGFSNLLWCRSPWVFWNFATFLTKLSGNTDYSILTNSIYPQKYVQRRSNQIRKLIKTG